MLIGRHLEDLLTPHTLIVLIVGIVRLRLGRSTRLLGVRALRVRSGSLGALGKGLVVLGFLLLLLASALGKIHVSVEVTDCGDSGIEFSLDVSSLIKVFSHRVGLGVLLVTRKMHLAANVSLDGLVVSQLPHSFVLLVLDVVNGGVGATLIRHLFQVETGRFRFVFLLSSGPGAVLFRWSGLMGGLEVKAMHIGTVIALWLDRAANSGLQSAEVRVQVARAGCIANHRVALHMCDLALLLVGIAVVMGVQRFGPVHVVDIVRLHLEYEVAALYVRILRVEHAAVAIEGAADLVPARLVKEAEVVAPRLFKLLLLLVVVVNFNVIEEDVPGHVARIEIGPPGVESGCPKVHSQRRVLVKEFDGLMIIAANPANLVTVNGPGDVFRGPLESVGVPVVVDGMVHSVSSVLVVLHLVVTIAVDDICRDGRISD
mmetsp:Transcript_34065/g.42055  ORF Transcript_34065/g.42055 Transcript_34065/m.42055 type:complete len:429 (-) Transcript_34065:236-1522(-)